MTTDNRVTVIGTMTIVPGKKAEVLAGVTELVEGVEMEEGTLIYLVNTSDVPGEEPPANKLVFYESYVDQDALDIHLGTIAGKPESAYNLFIKNHGSGLIGWEQDDLDFTLYNRRGTVVHEY